MGYGEFVLIDPDIINETNIGTQQAFPETAGISKVEVLARDIVTINPASAVLSIKEGVENIDDKQFALLFSESLREKASSTCERMVLTEYGFHNSSFFRMA